jgi:hypothetical protein
VRDGPDLPRDGPELLREGPELLRDGPELLGPELPPEAPLAWAAFRPIIAGET